METEDHGARPAGIEFLWAPPQWSAFCGLWESSSPFPLNVGPLLSVLDALLRQERLLVVWGSAECGEDVAVDEIGEGATDCPDSGLAAPWRAGWTLLIFSEDDPLWLL